jgi:hypothetical protein
VEKIEADLLLSITITNGESGWCLPQCFHDNWSRTSLSVTMVYLLGLS